MKDIKRVAQAVSANAGVKIEIVDSPLGFTKGFMQKDGYTYAYINEACSARFEGVDKYAQTVATLCMELINLNLRSSQDELGKFLQGVLTPTQEEVFLSTNKIKGEYYVYAISTKPQYVKEIKDALFNLSSHGNDDLFVSIRDDLFMYGRLLNAKNDDYKSAGAFAQLISANFKREGLPRFKIGLGGRAKTYRELKSAYCLAQFALTAGIRLDDSYNVFSYENYAIVNLLAQLPKQELKAFVAKYVKAPEIYNEPDYKVTVETLLNNDLNSSKTSKEMYIHRNTLKYRLDRIETATGLDVRTFHDAMTFRIISIILQIIGE